MGTAAARRQWRRMMHPMHTHLMATHAPVIDLRRRVQLQREGTTQPSLSSIGCNGGACGATGEEDGPTRLAGKRRGCEFLRWQPASRQTARRNV